MLLSLDFPRDDELLEPSGIQARPELAPDPFDSPQRRGDHSRTTIKIYRGWRSPFRIECLLYDTGECLKVDG
jgi:hypothetical protein